MNQTSLIESCCRNTEYCLASAGAGLALTGSPVMLGALKSLQHLFHFSCVRIVLPLVKFTSIITLCPADPPTSHHLPVHTQHHRNQCILTSTQELRAQPGTRMSHICTFTPDYTSELCYIQPFLPLQKLYLLALPGL